MTKRMTRLLSLILTLVMFLSVVTPAYAVGGDDEPDEGWDREIGEDEIHDLDIDGDLEFEEEYDYFQTLDEETGVQVTIEAPMGSLPTLAEVRLEPIPAEDLMDAVEDLLDADHQILLAMDISFWLGEDEIEPEEPVRVKISAPELEGCKDLTVVHFPDDAEEPETMQLIPEEDLTFALGTNEICFESADFSVYAVIGGSANDLKLTVEFYESATATTPLSTQVLVLEQFDEEGEKPLIDPGVPSITATQSFEGWRIDAEHEKLDINGLNAYIHETYGSMTDNATLRVNAMIFNVRYVIYHDQAGAVLKTQSFHVEESSTADVLIKHPYVGFKGTQNFAGWVLEEKVEVAGDYPLYADDLGTIYKNDQTYQLSDTIDIYPYLNTGSWLVFDTYKDQDDDATSTSFVAPVFYEEGENTVAPTPPTRTGYKFVGWYKDKQFSTRFVFGSPLNEGLTIYAKWEPQTAKYTVVFWQQKNTDTPTTENADKQYDFYASVERSANTGDSVSIQTATSGETADNRLAYNSDSANGEMGYYFLYNEANTDTGSKVVKGDGSTVLNVYYDRKTITYKFYEADKTTLWTPTGGYVAAENGDYYYYTAQTSGYYLIGTGPNADYRPTDGDTIYYLYNINSTNYPTVDEADTYFRANYPTLASNNTSVKTYSYDSSDDLHYSTNGSLYEYYQFSGYSYYSWIAYYYLFTETYTTGYYPVGTGPNPTAVGTHNQQGATGSNTISGLYGAQLPLSDWPNSGDGYVWANDETINGSSSTYYYPLALTEYVPVQSEGAAPTTEMKFYLTSDSGTAMHIYYVTQPIGSQEYTQILTHGTNLVGSNGATWYPNETIQGFKVEKYRFGTSGNWTNCTEATGISISSGSQDLYVAFSRNTHRLLFVSNNAEVTPDGLPEGTDLNAIPYDMVLSSLKDVEPKNGNEGYFFDGWYADDSFSTPFDFSSHMPDNNVRVYAKWTQIRFRVVCDPRGGDTKINPADIVIPNGQSTTFRIDYGEAVEGSNLNSMTREGYTLLGWYLDTDPDNDSVFDTPFTFATPITTNSTHADMTYGVQGEDESDEAYIARRSGTDPWKDNKAYNDEDGEHDDVVGKVVIYAKWREDPDGIIGINVRYDAVESSAHEGYFGTDETNKIWDDPDIYADQAQAYAQPASTPKDYTPALKFLYWDILDAEGNSTGRKAYPGQTWEVHFADAKEEAISSTTSEEEPTLITFDTPIPNLIMPGEIQSTGPSIPYRATSSYQRVTTLTPGKKYLITYTSGNNVYILGNSLNSSNNITAVNATASNGVISGNYDNYLFGVQRTSSGYYQFGSLYSFGYLGITGTSRALSLSADSSYRSWQLTSRNYLLNTGTTTSAGYPIIQYNNGVFRGNDSSNNSYQVITFYEYVEPAISGETFEIANNLKVGGRYIIAIDTHALGGDYTAVGSDNTPYYVSSVNVLHNTSGTESVTVNTTDVSNVTWVIESGNASDGYVLKNQGTGKYLSMNSAYYVCAGTTPHAWTYDGSDLNNNVTDSGNEGYLYLTYSSAFDDFTTTTGTGNNVKFYAATTTYTVTFKDGRTNEVIETQEVEEGGSATPPQAPDHTDTGWIFSGWDTPFDNIYRDVTITAQYVNQSTLSYTVTFRYMDANGDWVTDSQTVQHGEAATEPTVPTPPAGYEFNSWDKKFNQITSNLTVNAVYKQVATKKYVVTLRAVYGRADAGSVTHINWYSNIYDAYGNPIPDASTETSYVPANTLFPNGIAEKSGSKATFAYEGGNTPTYGDHGYNLIYDTVEIPESVRIPEKPYAIPGYKFLGWARIADANSIPEGANASDYVTDPAQITPDDVYIRWNEAQNRYEAKDASNNWVTVTYVAANEQKPYHDMYAVWVGEFYIYHSGMEGGAVEKVTIDFKGGYDLTARVTALSQSRADEADKFLYGGYYLEGGFTAPAVDDKGVPTATCAAYNGANWTWTTPVTDQPGNAITPKGGVTYYIKEVPASAYLQSYFHYTYKKEPLPENQTLSSAWVISAIDDAMYKETGFVIIKNNDKANVCTQLTVETAVGGTKVVLKPQNIFRSKDVKEGDFLSYLEVMTNGTKNLGFDENVTVLQYWVTPDNMIVTGIASRSYGSLANKTAAKSGLTDATVHSTIGVFSAPAAEPEP